MSSGLESLRVGRRTIPEASFDPTVSCPVQAICVSSCLPRPYFCWPLHKLHLKSAIFQTGTAALDVYIIPPRESADNNKVPWILLTKDPGGANANYKWRDVISHLLPDIRFEPEPLIPGLFTMHKDDYMVAFAAEIVYLSLFTVQENISATTIYKSDALLCRSIVVDVPGAVCFFGVNLFQHDDMTFEVNYNEKENGIACMEVSALRCGESNTSIKYIERKFFILQGICRMACDNLVSLLL